MLRDSIILAQQQAETETPVNPWGGTVVARVNMGAAITADDGGPDWLSKNVTGSWTSGNISINQGAMYSQSGQPIQGAGDVDASIPSYITQSVFDQIFTRQTYISAASGPITLTVDGLDYGTYRIIVYNGKDTSDDNIDQFSVNGEIFWNFINTDTMHQTGSGYAFAIDVDIFDTQLVFEMLSQGGDNTSFFAIEVIKLDNGIDTIGITTGDDASNPFNDTNSVGTWSSNSTMEVDTVANGDGTYSIRGTANANGVSLGLARLYAYVPVTQSGRHQIRIRARESTGANGRFVDIRNNSGGGNYHTAYEPYKPYFTDTETEYVMYSDEFDGTTVRLEIFIYSPTLGQELIIDDLVIMPIVDNPNDLFPSGNAASDGYNEADATTGWVLTNGTLIMSSQLNEHHAKIGRYMLDLTSNNQAWNGVYMDVTGLNLVPHKFTVWARLLDTDATRYGAISFSDLTGADNIGTTDFDGTEWLRREFVATPVNGTVRITARTDDATPTGTGRLQISKIVITEQ